MGILDNIRAAGKVLIGTATAHEAAESTRRLKGWQTTDTELNTLVRNAGNSNIDTRGVGIRLGFSRLRVERRLPRLGEAKRRSGQATWWRI